MIDLEILSEALVGTVNSRGTSNVLQNGDEIIEDVLTSDAMSINWKRYQKKYSQDQWMTNFSILSLGELRGIFGEHLAYISVKYEIDLDEDLGGILPVIDDE